MSNFDKEEFLFSIVTGLLLSLLLVVLLWLLKFVWTFSPISVVAFIVLVPVTSYIVYKNIDSF